MHFYIISILISIPCTQTHPYLNWHRWYHDKTLFETVKGSKLHKYHCLKGRTKKIKTVTPFRTHLRFSNLINLKSIPRKKCSNEMKNHLKKCKIVGITSSASSFVLNSTHPYPLHMLLPSSNLSSTRVAVGKNASLKHQTQ